MKQYLSEQVVSILMYMLNYHIRSVWNVYCRFVSETTAIFMYGTLVTFTEIFLFNVLKFDDYLRGFYICTIYCNSVFHSIDFGLIHSYDRNLCITIYKESSLFPSHKPMKLIRHYYDVQLWFILCRALFLLCL